MDEGEPPSPRSKKRKKKKRKTTWETKLSKLDNFGYLIDLRLHRPLLDHFPQGKYRICLLEAFSLRIAEKTKQRPVRLSVQQLIDHGPKEYAQAIRSNKKRVCGRYGIYTLKLREICDFISGWGVCRDEDYKYNGERNPNPPNFFDKPRYKLTGYKLLERCPERHYCMKLERLL